MHVAHLGVPPSHCREHVSNCYGGFVQAASSLMARARERAFDFLFLHGTQALCTHRLLDAFVSAWPLPDAAGDGFSSSFEAAARAMLIVCAIAARSHSSAWGARKWWSQRSKRPGEDSGATRGRRSSCCARARNFSSGRIDSGRDADGHAESRHSSSGEGRKG